MMMLTKLQIIHSIRVNKIIKDDMVLIQNDINDNDKEWHGWLKDWLTNKDQFWNFSIQKSNEKDFPSDLIFHFWYKKTAKPSLANKVQWRVERASQEK